jgi:phenylacetate-CoA ligase
MGRADQTTKIKGMFVRPEQVADLVARLDGVERARVIASREGEMDTMTVQLEGAGSASDYEAVVSDILKMRGTVEMMAPGTLPRDGVVIEDQRNYD